MLNSEQLAKAMQTERGIQTFLRRAVVFVLSLGALAGAQDPQTAPVPAPETAATQPSPPAKSTQQADSTPAELLRSFKSMYVSSKTVYIKKGITEGALLKELQKKHLDLDIAIKTDSSAEAVLSIERQAVWPQWDYIYRLDHQATGTVLDAGKVRAIDGGSAAKQIAQKSVARIAEARNSGTKH